MVALVSLLQGAVITATFTATAYAPGAGGINGDWIDARGYHVTPYTIACGPKYLFHVFVFDSAPDGTPTVRVCTDRGGAIGNGNVDFVLMPREGETDAERIKRAYQWGKRTVTARVYTIHEWLAMGAAIGLRDE